MLGAVYMQADNVYLLTYGESSLRALEQLLERVSVHTCSRVQVLLFASLVR